jgi:hypothetical protein
MGVVDPDTDKVIMTGEDLIKLSQKKTEKIRSRMRKV